MAMSVQVKAAIVTCGGLCPGLNDVIRQVMLPFLTLSAMFITIKLMQIILGCHNRGSLAL